MAAAEARLVQGGPSRHRIELETNHRSVDPSLRDFDAWLAYSGETSAPRPLTRREDTLLEETLYAHSD